MNAIIKILLKIKSGIIKLMCLIVIFIKSIFSKNKIYLFGTPIHGNIGDQAILIAEKKFLKDNFHDYKIINIESSIIIRFNWIIKKIVRKSTILMHGGGFLGTLWINEEEMFRKTLKSYPNNKIIVFPQTVYFSDDENGKKTLEESRKIYSTHPNLHICCREKYSYDFMKKEFSKCNVYLVPDMVLYLEQIGQNIERENILFCIREDKEKLDYNFEKLIDYFDKKGYKIDYTDTVINKNIFGINREKILNKKIMQFSKYKLIVTDRLHGMIFSLLSNTPCLVFENKSYKIKGVYEWIKEVRQIKLITSRINEEDIDKLINGDNSKMIMFNIKKLYRPLVRIIKDNL